jgi:hypothetical protein
MENSIPQLKVLFSGKTENKGLLEGSSQSVNAMMPFVALAEYGQAQGKVKGIKLGIYFPAWQQVVVNSSNEAVLYSQGRIFVEDFPRIDLVTAYRSMIALQESNGIQISGRGRILTYNPVSISPLGVYSDIRLAENRMASGEKCPEGLESIMKSQLPTNEFDDAVIALHASHIPFAQGSIAREIKKGNLAQPTKRLTDLAEQYSAR